MHQRSAIELGLLLGLFILASAPARAQVTDMRVQVNGMACPFCTRGVQKKLKELDGVQEVNVGLKEGNAALILEEGKAPTIHELKEAVKDAGFTPTGGETFTNGADCKVARPGPSRLGARRRFDPRDSGNRT